MKISGAKFLFSCMEIFYMHENVIFMHETFGMGVTMLIAFFVVQGLQTSTLSHQHATLGLKFF